MSRNARTIIALLLTMMLASAIAGFYLSTEDNPLSVDYVAEGGEVWV